MTMHTHFDISQSSTQNYIDQLQNEINSSILLLQMANKLPPTLGSTYDTNVLPKDNNLTSCTPSHFGTDNFSYEDSYLSPMHYGSSSLYSFNSLPENNINSSHNTYDAQFETSFKSQSPKDDLKNSNCPPIIQELYNLSLQMEKGVLAGNSHHSSNTKTGDSYSQLYNSHISDGDPPFKFNNNILEISSLLEYNSSRSLASTNYSEVDSTEEDQGGYGFPVLNSQTFNKEIQIGEYSYNTPHEVHMVNPSLTKSYKLLPSLTKRLEKTQLCRHFSRNGKCANGIHCAFAHSLNELRDRPDLSKTRICTDYQLGQCKYGSLCKHAHSDVELRSTSEFYKTSLCPDFMRFGTCHRSHTCRFAHGTSDLRQRFSNK